MRLNLIEERLDDLDYAKAAGFLINGLEREEIIAMNSMIFHELFFEGLGDESEPGALSKTRLPEISARGGGADWVLLSWSPHDRKLANQWAADHCHMLAGGIPILALDMYEHSYHMDFGTKAASYADTFMSAIRWTNADQLFSEVGRDAGI